MASYKFNCSFNMILIALIVLLSTIPDNECVLRETQIELLRGVTIRNWPFIDRIGNKYEGFLVDLMNEIKEINGFEYRLYLSPDNKYGTVQEGKVNGMIGEVANYRADFALADLTVTDIRKEYVDFTEPFMTVHLSVLIHKSHIGNITSFEDLAEQTDISYGTYRMSSTFNLFSKSTDPTFRKMYEYMVRNPQVLVTNAREGVERVNNTRFAFIVESAFSAYLSGIYCNLTYIVNKNPLMTRDYAIAVNKGSQLKEKFSSAIRDLKSNGKLDRLRRHFWNNSCAANFEWLSKDYETAGYSGIHNSNHMVVLVELICIFLLVIASKRYV